MTYAQERVAEVWDEAAELLLRHVAEVGVVGLGFDPKRAVYEGLDAAGVLRLHTVRDGDAKLVGYSTFVIMPHPQYAGTFAIQDGLYLLEAYRGVTGVRFIAWVDEQLADGGAEWLMRQVNVRHDYTRTLERLGYAPFQTAFIKRV